ncbi:hypothetical protein LINGRAHAP2_LOCUS33107, partial [Linum grandiflorum]
PENSYPPRRPALINGFTDLQSILVSSPQLSSCFLQFLCESFDSPTIIYHPSWIFLFPMLSPTLQPLKRRRLHSSTVDFQPSMPIPTQDPIRCDRRLSIEGLVASYKREMDMHPDLSHISIYPLFVA